MLVSSTVKNLEYLQKVLSNPELVCKVTEALVLLAHDCESDPSNKEKRKNLDASARFAKLVQDIAEERGLWSKHSKK